MQITLKSAKDTIIKCLEVVLVPILSSKPGVGKSDLIKSIANELNLELIDIRLSQCEPTDLLGMPYITENYATYVPMKMFPLEGQELPKGKDGWLIFFDELRNADVHTQQAAYKTILDKMVGEHRLHERVVMVAAGNTEADNCFVNPMPSALKSRLVHLNIDVNASEWLLHAVSNDFDGRITSYIGFKKEMLYTDHTDSAEESYGCPRTWEFASRIIKGEKDLTTTHIKAALAGCLGEGVAAEFATYCKYFTKLPSYKDIVKNPKKQERLNKKDLGLVWATIGMLANNLELQDLEAVMTYVEDQLPQEFQLLFVKDITKRYPGKITQQKIMQPWLVKIRDVMF